jgi:galactokinase
MALLAALNATWELELTLDQLVERGIVAERHVGVESGGMDQTVIAHASDRTALRIDFHPPSHRPVPLPDRLRVVVAYSGQEAPKGGAVKHRYNARVVSCRLAAALLAHQLGQTVELPPVLAHVAGAQRVASLVEDLPERATPTAIASQLGLAAAPLVRLTAGTFDHDVQVPIRSVARHVLGEARRVDQMEEALRSDDLPRVGQLLDASHRSLAEDFGCSTEALDRLCTAMRQAGAAGARLTGAGFGGFAVAVTEPDRVGLVIEAAPSMAFEVAASPGLEVMVER